MVWNDSTFIALVKYKFGLRPLLATVPFIPNEIGTHNREIVLKHGFDGIILDQIKDLLETCQRDFFERGLKLHDGN